MQFNNRFFEELSVSPAVTALVTEVAEDVAEIARNTGPRDTDAYVNGINVRVKRQQRSVALVVASDPKSLLIESKSGVLARALKQVRRRG